MFNAFCNNLMLLPWWVLIMDESQSLNQMQSTAKSSCFGGLGRGVAFQALADNCLHTLDSDQPKADFETDGTSICYKLLWKMFRNPG